MFIQHDPPASALSHGGKTYEADEHGTFDVPEEVGRELTARAGFSQYIGQPEGEVDEAPADDNAVAELEAEVERLRGALAKATKPKPAKRSTKKAAAKPKDAPKGDSEGGETKGDEPPAPADEAPKGK